MREDQSDSECEDGNRNFDEQHDYAADDARIEEPYRAEQEGQNQPDAHAFGAARDDDVCLVCSHDNEFFEV